MAQYYTSLEGVNIQNTWLTIGSFDGVHLGHQQLIHQLNTNAHLAAAKSVVLTFYPHPSVVLRGRSGAFYLTTPTEKANILDDLGIDIIITHPFTHQVSQSTAQDFILYLLDHLGFQQLWVGYDFALGRGREGNVSFLRELGKEHNYQVHIFEPVTSNGKTISSSHIRRLLQEGKVEEANSCLGRQYQVVGKVIHGDGRGKSIGIPTANLDPGNEKLIPRAGIYACQVKIKDKSFPAAVNIGTRPTFESIDQKSHVEAHILDYYGDLYDQQITIVFISRLRDELRFGSVEELIIQIHKDIEKTREVIGDLANGLVSE